jgi:hypothetical protein
MKSAPNTAIRQQRFTMVRDPVDCDRRFRLIVITQSRGDHDHAVDGDV